MTFFADRFKQKTYRSMSERESMGKNIMEQQDYGKNFDRSSKKSSDADTNFFMPDRVNGLAHLLGAPKTKIRVGPVNWISGHLREMHDFSHENRALPQRTGKAHRQSKKGETRRLCDKGIGRVLKNVRI